MLRAKSRMRGTGRGRSPIQHLFASDIIDHMAPHRLASQAAFAPVAMTVDESASCLRISTLSLDMLSRGGEGGGGGFGARRSKSG